MNMEALPAWLRCDCDFVYRSQQLQNMLFFWILNSRRDVAQPLLGVAAFRIEGERGAELLGRALVVSDLRQQVAAINVDGGARAWRSTPAMPLHYGPASEVPKHD